MGVIYPSPSTVKGLGGGGQSFLLIHSPVYGRKHWAKIKLDKLNLICYTVSILNKSSLKNKSYHITWHDISSYRQDVNVSKAIPRYDTRFRGLILANNPLPLCCSLNGYIPQEGSITMAERERIATWEFNTETTELILKNAQTKVEVAKVTLRTDFPEFDTLPEFVKVAYVFGVKQQAADGNGSLKGEAKLEGYKLDLLEYTKATFARAKTARGEQISMSAVKAQTWSLQDLRFMKSDFFPKLGKAMPAELVAKLEELEEAGKKALEEKAAKKR